MGDIPEQRSFTIGREMGVVGRGARLGVGLLGCTGVLAVALRIGPSSLLFGQIAAGALLALAFYIGLFWALGKRLLKWFHPWARTVIFRGPLALALLPLLPLGLRLGIFLYVFAASILNALIRYGGCEIVAVPSLLFRRRYAVYCELNALDQVERPLRQTPRRLVRLIGGALALLVGSYLVLISVRAFFGISLPYAPWMPALLFLPALLLLWDAWRTSRLAGGRLTREVRESLLGVAALVIVAILYGLGIFL